MHLRFMDRVVCVSAGQADRVPERRRPPEASASSATRRGFDAFTESDPAGPDRLRELAGGAGPIVVAAGRLSPEKGFRVLVDAARNGTARRTGRPVCPVR